MVDVVDDFGKEHSGLWETHMHENQFDDIDHADEWDRRTAAHDDEYTGEALIDRQLEQKKINSMFHPSDEEEEDSFL